MENCDIIFCNGGLIQEEEETTKPTTEKTVDLLKAAKAEVSSVYMYLCYII